MKKAKIVSIDQITPSTRSFILENIVEEDPSFHFKAGQFVTLDLPISDKKTKRLKSYSIASSPSITKRIELIVSLAPNGEGGSEYLFHKTQVGTELSYKGPQGVFVLPQTIERDIYFICTGVGIAPFLSMLYEIFQRRNQNDKRFYLIFGCRTREELIYPDILRNMEKECSHFSYIPTLSRESWQGHTGYVHDVYTKMLVNKPDADFFICGWKNMVDEAVERLKEIGYDKRYIHFELYG